LIRRHAEESLETKEVQHDDDDKNEDPGRLVRLGKIDNPPNRQREDQNHQHQISKSGSCVTLDFFHVISY